MYAKISNTQEGSSKEIIDYSLNLKTSESIIDTKIIDENIVLFVISDDDQSYLIMYNLKENKIISRIGK